VTHSKIKRFQQTGTVANDTDLIRIKSLMVNEVINIMRADGYVPLLDLTPAWSVSYNDEHYDFLLTVHGVYCGRSQAKKVYGVLGQEKIPME
jgi:hypothetical protein